MATLTSPAVMLPPLVKPVHDHALPEYPDGPLSVNVYVPALTPCATPEMNAVVPAFRVKSLTTAIPPLSFVTCLTSVSDEFFAFVNVQVVVAPATTWIAAGVP